MQALTLPVVTVSQIPSRWHITDAVKRTMAQQMGCNEFELGIVVAIEMPEHPISLAWQRQQMQVDDSVPIIIVNKDDYEQQRGQGAGRASMEAALRGTIPDSWAYVSYLA